MGFLDFIFSKDPKKNKVDDFLGFVGKTATNAARATPIGQAAVQTKRALDTPEERRKAYDTAKKVPVLKEAIEFTEEDDRRRRAGEEQQGVGDFVKAIGSTGYKYSPIPAILRTGGRGVAELQADQEVDIPTVGKTKSFSREFNEEGALGALLNIGFDAAEAIPAGKMAATAAKAGGKKVVTAAADELRRGLPTLASEAGHIRMFGGAEDAADEAADLVAGQAKKLFRGFRDDAGKPTTEAIEKAFENPITFANDQRDALTFLADRGDQTARRVLKEMGDGKIDYGTVDPYLKQKFKELGHDAIEYKNSTGFRKAHGTEVHDLNAPARQDFYAEKPETASVYSMQNRRGLRYDAKVAQKEVASVAPKGQGADAALQAVQDGAGLTDPVERGAQVIAKQLTDFDEALKPSEALNSVLGKATPKARKETIAHGWLEKLRDTRAVASDYFGKVGSDIVDMAAYGAKVHSDFQQATRPLIEKSQKLLKQMDDTDIGKRDIQERIYRALEDRDNFEQYLRTDKEKELFEATREMFDMFRTEIQKRGRGTLENYAPRTLVRHAIDAPDRLYQNIKGSFASNVEAKYLKERSKDIPEGEIETRIIELMPHYANSIAKDFAYGDVVNYFTENMNKVNPVYTTNKELTRQGEQYMQNLFKQILNPRATTKAERFANRGLGTTYRSALALSPRYALQNATQRFIANSQVSREARKAWKKMSTEDLDAVKQFMSTNDASVIMQDLSEVPRKSLLDKIDPAIKVEKGNLETSFAKGLTQQLVESPIYKEAKKAGASTRDALHKALEDPATKDLAIRRGNVVVSDTQFGANAVLKPEFFRDNGFFILLPKSFVRQYKRFQAGMVENIVNTLKTKDAQALDILKRGDPRQTKLVDYSRAAKTMTETVEDIKKAVKNGTVTDVTVKDVDLYLTHLKKATGELDKQIAKNSQLRRGKSLKNLGKMWASAAAIQFLFDGGFSAEDDEELGANAGKALTFSAPVSIPSEYNNPLEISMPSAPNPFDGWQGRDTRKMLNFVPGVGIAVNRGRDLNRFLKALNPELQGAE